MRYRIIKVETGEEWYNGVYYLLQTKKWYMFKWVTEKESRGYHQEKKQDLIFGSVDVAKLYFTNQYKPVTKTIVHKG